MPGPATAGANVTGKLATITRSDGSTQATSDGHPLDTYVGDTAPGQANGNGLNLSGGVWHEMTVSGAPTWIQQLVQPRRRWRLLTREEVEPRTWACSARRPGSSQLRLALRLAGAGLLIAAGAIYLDLYLTGYRSIPVIGWLFLFQVIAAFALAVVVLASGSRLAAAAGAGFAVATLGGYLLSVWIGLFGFKEVRTTAGIVAGLIEVAAFAVLAILAAAPHLHCPFPQLRGMRLASYHEPQPSQRSQPPKNPGQSILLKLHPTEICPTQFPDYADSRIMPIPA